MKNGYSEFIHQKSTSSFIMWLWNKTEKYSLGKIKENTTLYISMLEWLHRNLILLGMEEWNMENEKSSSLGWEDWTHFSWTDLGSLEILYSFLLLLDKYWYSHFVQYTCYQEAFAFISNTPSLVNIQVGTRVVCLCPLMYHYTF